MRPKIVIIHFFAYLDRACEIFTSSSSFLCGGSTTVMSRRCYISFNQAAAAVLKVTGAVNKVRVGMTCLRDTVSSSHVNAATCDKPQQILIHVSNQELMP